MIRPRLTAHSGAAWLTSLLLVLPAAYAKGDMHGNRPHQGPPPEAIEACSGQAEGDECRFTGRRDDVIEGTCLFPPHDEQILACVPEGGPPHGPRR
jgi:hypothetical protein